MSGKKYKKIRRSRRFPWWWVILGGTLLTISALLFTNRDAGGGIPSIAVDQQEIDYGDQHFDTNLTFAIKVTNTGDGTLRFKEDPYIEVVEGC